MRLERPDEQQQERLVEQQVVEQLQSAVKPVPPRQVNLLNVKQEHERGVRVEVRGCEILTYLQNTEQY